MFFISSLKQDLMILSNIFGSENWQNCTQLTISFAAVLLLG